MEARCVATGSPRLTEGARVAHGPRSRLVGWAALAFATLALATLALAARADAYVYWTDGAKDTIGRANLDGTGVDRSFIRGLVHPEAIAVDTTHGYLYWVSANPCCTSDPGGTIGRAKLDGTGVDPDFISTRTYAGNAMAVDDAHIYWVSKVSDPSPTNPFGQSNTGTIGRANLDGTGVDPDFISGIGSPHGVAVDGAHVYWDDTHTTVTPTGSVSDFAIGRANLDGTGVDQSFIEPGGGNGLAVDDAHVYWSVATWINRANIDGAGAEYGFIDLQRIDTVMYEIAVNGSHIYWIGNVGPSRNAIGRANLDGSRVTNKLITGFNPFGGSDPTGLALDALGPPPSNEFGFRGVKVNKNGVGEAHGQGGGSRRAQARKDRKPEGHAHLGRAVGRGEADGKAEGQGKEEAEQEGQGDREGEGDLYPRRRHLRHQEQEHQAGQAVARPQPTPVRQGGDSPARQEDRLRTPEIPTVRVGAGFRTVGATGFEPATRNCMTEAEALKAAGVLE